jgi:hypothetical protein
VPALALAVVGEKEEKMSTDNWNLPSGAPRCVFADALYRTAKDTIFSKLRMDTTPGEFAAAQESLRLLREELERDMPAMHYAAQIGSHRCVKDLYREARAWLRTLAVLQPVPHAPAPKQQLLTIEGVVIEIEERFRTSATETDLGTTE